ncbi:unnamed protein product [Amoebophrya sp. A25]|nr:unnamed protein product [Amoebophrya sp. A25]|eukprot:GSA25T00018698001.1
MFFKRAPSESPASSRQSPKEKLATHHEGGSDASESDVEELHRTSVNPQQGGRSVDDLATNKQSPPPGTSSSADNNTTLSSGSKEDSGAPLRYGRAAMSEFFTAGTRHAGPGGRALVDVDGRPITDATFMDDEEAAAEALEEAKILEAEEFMGARVPGHSLKPSRVGGASSAPNHIRGGRSAPPGGAPSLNHQTVPTAVDVDLDNVGGSAPLEEAGDERETANGGLEERQLSSVTTEDDEEVEFVGDRRAVVSAVYPRRGVASQHRGASLVSQSSALLRQRSARQGGNNDPAQNSVVAHVNDPRASRTSVELYEADVVGGRGHRDGTASTGPVVMHAAPQKHRKEKDGTRTSDVPSPTVIKRTASANVRKAAGGEVRASGRPSSQIVVYPDGGDAEGGLGSRQSSRAVAENNVGLAVDEEPLSRRLQSEMNSRTMSVQQRVGKVRMPVPNKKPPPQGRSPKQGRNSSGGQSMINFGDQANKIMASGSSRGNSLSPTASKQATGVFVPGAMTHTAAQEQHAQFFPTVYGGQLQPGAAQLIPVVAPVQTFTIQSAPPVQQPTVQQHSIFREQLESQLGSADGTTDKTRANSGPPPPPVEPPPREDQQQDEGEDEPLVPGRKINSINPTGAVLPPGELDLTVGGKANIVGTIDEAAVQQLWNAGSGTMWPLATTTAGGTTLLPATGAAGMPYAGQTTFVNPDGTTTTLPVTLMPSGFPTSGASSDAQAMLQLMEGTPIAGAAPGPLSWMTPASASLGITPMSGAADDGDMLFPAGAHIKSSEQDAFFGDHGVAQDPGTNQNKSGLSTPGSRVMLTTGGSCSVLTTGKQLILPAPPSLNVGGISYSVFSRDASGVGAMMVPAQSMNLKVPGLGKKGAAWAAGNTAWGGNNGAAIGYWGKGKGKGAKKGAYDNQSYNTGGAGADANYGSVAGYGAGKGQEGYATGGKGSVRWDDQYNYYPTTWGNGYDGSWGYAGYPGYTDEIQAAQHSGGKQSSKAKGGKAVADDAGSKEKTTKGGAAATNEAAAGNKNNAKDSSKPLQGSPYSNFSASTKAATGKQASKGTKAAGGSNKTSKQATRGKIAASPQNASTTLEKQAKNAGAAGASGTPSTATSLPVDAADKKLFAHLLAKEGGGGELGAATTADKNDDGEQTGTSAATTTVTTSTSANKKVDALHQAAAKGSATAGKGSTSTGRKKKAKLSKGQKAARKLQVQRTTTWHSEAATMGVVDAMGQFFKNQNYAGRLSALSENQVRTGGVHRYCVSFHSDPEYMAQAASSNKSKGSTSYNTANKGKNTSSSNTSGGAVGSATTTNSCLCNADGLGFVFSDKLPCTKNIQKINSVFLNKKGVIMVRLQDELGDKRKDETNKLHIPFEEGSVVWMQVDLDRARAIFWLGSEDDEKDGFVSPQSPGSSSAQPESSSSDPVEIQDYERDIPWERAVHLDFAKYFEEKNIPLACGFLTVVLKNQGSGCRLVSYQPMLPQVDSIAWSPTSGEQPGSAPVSGSSNGDSQQAGDNVETAKSAAAQVAGDATTASKHQEVTTSGGDSEDGAETPDASPKREA